MADIKAQNQTALASVKAIYDAADEATTLLDGMKQAAQDAGTTLDGIYQDAEDAQESAGRAMESADSAKQSADTAFKQLSVVEDIVGVLDLISKNGDYRLTQDTEVIVDKWYFTRGGTDPNYVYNIATIETFYRKTEDTEIEEGKTYYTRSGTAPDYVYTPVENPVVEDIETYYEAYQDPSQQGLYELFGIDQSIQNYVSSHLVLSGNTLSLRTDGSDYRLDLTSTGMQIIGANGLPIATYGTETIVGREDDFHIKMDGNELGFYRGAYKIAYMSGEKLYIPQSVVLQQMDVGLPYGHIDPTTQQQDGFGQWSWKLHLNNENPPRNNLNLKWIG